MVEVTFTALPDSSDARGASYSLLGDLIGSMKEVRDAHIASVRPGAIRGNHYHGVRNEIITVVFADAWAFYWDTGDGTAVHRRQFTGSGAVAIGVPQYWSHAVKNEGELDLWLFNLSDIDTNRESGTASDAFTRRVVE